jgi:hypothetical protein
MAVAYYSKSPFNFSDACFKDYTTLVGTVISNTPRISTPFHCSYMCKKKTGNYGINVKM